MDVVCHERVCTDADTVLSTSFLQCTRIHQEISVFMKQGLLSNTALIHVMRTLRYGAPVDSRHKTVFLVGNPKGVLEFKSGPDYLFPIFCGWKNGKQVVWPRFSLPGQDCPFGI